MTHQTHHFNIQTNYWCTRVFLHVHISSTNCSHTSVSLLYIIENADIIADVGYSPITSCIHIIQRITVMKTFITHITWYLAFWILFGLLIQCVCCTRLINCYMHKMANLSETNNTRDKCKSHVLECLYTSQRQHDASSCIILNRPTSISNRMHHCTKFI